MSNLLESIQFMRLLKEFSFFDESIFHGPSPLKNYGYEVGKSSRLSPEQRREKLYSFWIARYGDRITDPVKTEWGAQKSNERLLAMRRHISAMAFLRYKDPRKDTYRRAICDWVEDIDFLEAIYLSDGIKNKAKWPRLSHDILEFVNSGELDFDTIPF